MCQPHEHMTIEIPPKINVSSFAGFLKRKSGLMVYERWRNIKFKYRNREFWSKPVLSAEKNARKIVENLQNLLKEDGSSEHLT